MNELLKKIGAAILLIAVPVIAAYIVGLSMGLFEGILGL